MSVREERHPDRMTLNRMLNFVSFLYELLEGNDVQPDDLMEKNNLIEEKRSGRRTIRFVSNWINQMGQLTTIHTWKNAM